MYIYTVRCNLVVTGVKESLWPGCHAFPFQYTLPTKLPTSFHGRFGYVRYFCEASLERAWQPSVRRRAYFSVSAAVDVNLDPKAEVCFIIQTFMF
jgi:hypothetical protein